MAGYSLGPHFKKPRGLMVGLPVLAWLAVLCAVVLSFYWVMRTHEAKESAVMRRRRIGLSLLTDASMTINQALCALIILCLTFNLPRTYHFTLAGSTFITCLTIYLFIWRSILIWIDLEWSRRVLSPEWRTILTSPYFNASLFDPTINTRRSYGGYIYDPSTQSSETDLHSKDSNRLLKWILRNKKKLGSNRNLGFVCLFCAFVSWVLIFTVWTAVGDVSLTEKRKLSKGLLIGKVLLFGLPAIFLVILQRSMPEFDDSFAIGKEMRRLSIIVLATVMMLTSLSLWRLAIPGEKHSWLHYILQISEQLVTAMANFAACMICTAWVLRTTHRIVSVDLLIQIARRKKLYDKNYDNEQIGLQSRRDEMEEDLGSEFYARMPGTPTLSTQYSSQSGMGTMLFGAIKSPSQMQKDFVYDGRRPGKGLKAAFKGFPKVEPMGLGRTSVLPIGIHENETQLTMKISDDYNMSGDENDTVNSFHAPIGFGGSSVRPMMSGDVISAAVITSEAKATSSSDLMAGMAAQPSIHKSLLSSHNSNSSIKVKRSYQINEIKLEHVLSHIVSLEMFAEYLATELSMANLLCLMECVQYQSYAVSRMKQRILDTGASMDANDCDNMCKMYVNIQLPIQLPHSFIVFDSTKSWAVRCSERDLSLCSTNENGKVNSNFSSLASSLETPVLSSVKNNDRYIQSDVTITHEKSEIEKMFKLKKLSLEDEMRLKGRLLYDRYFAENSPLSVNISEISKCHMSGIIGECEFEDWVKNGLDLPDLLRLFDGPGFTMIRLLRGSFARWRLTPHFQTVYDTVDFTVINPY